MPISPVPQILQFTDKLILILGNGANIQIYADPSGPPSLVSTIASSPTGAVENAAGNTATITTNGPHGLVTGQQAVLFGITNNAFTGPLGYGVFVVTVTGTNTFTVNNTVAAPNATSGGGTVTPSVQPITSNFIPAFPTWSASTVFAQNSIITPTISNGLYYTATQGGVSAATEPSFPTAIGQQVQDGSIIWSATAQINTAAPPPPGANVGIVYAGSLWVFNTSPTNTSDGIDGPCALRMSDVNNPNSWNPINVAFLDKDDGTVGMGLAAFTITAQGIPPEGSLVAFKNFSTYQIVGIFGSVQFSIQRIKSDMGCIAPRSIQFLPGFGIARLTHLGIAIFDGVDDHIISEEIRPYLFPSDDFPDITSMDLQNIFLCKSAQTADPPQYVLAIPIGSSGGSLTRILCYDLVLKAWTVTDLPFSISELTQSRTPGSTPTTLFGGFSDGVIQRWMAGDPQWYTGYTTPLNIGQSMQTPDVYSTDDPDQKLTCRRVAIKGINNTATSITITPIVDGINQPPQTFQIAVPSNFNKGDFEVFASVRMDGMRFSAIISASGRIEINRVDMHISPKLIGTPKVLV